MNQTFTDTQAALGFVTSQTSQIEAKVYKIKFQSIQYQDILQGCIDTTANPWAKTITYYTSEDFGAARWINGDSGDVPYGSAEQSKFETAVLTAGRGYQYGLEEINQAAMLGIPLDSDRARGARRAYEEFLDAVALSGDASKGMTGLFSSGAVPQAAVATGVGGVTWVLKTPAEILTDVNAAITATQTQTNTVSIADTLLLPFTKFNLLASTQLPQTTMTLLEFVKQNNVFTANTGRPLKIRSVRGLDTAGSGSTARMVAFRADPEVLKMHVPMPLRFLPVQVTGFTFKVPGMFRIGGLDIRLPKEMTYRDGI